MAADSREKPFPNEEPSHDLRKMASGVRQIFVALVHEGFTPAEALTIIGTMIAANIHKGDDGG